MVPKVRELGGGMIKSRRNSRKNKRLAASGVSTSREGKEANKAKYKKVTKGGKESNNISGEQSFSKVYTNSKT